MSYTIQWQVEKRVINIEITGELTIGEIVSLGKETAVFLEEGVAPIFAIVDVTHMTVFPTSISELTRLTPRHKHGRNDWTVIVGASHFVHLISNVVLSVLGLRYRSFPTRDEAVAFVLTQDETLAETFYA